MPVRTINKTDRVKLVTWIRSGAPLTQGVSLYATMPCNNRLLAALQKKPEAYKNELIADVCELLSISVSKFESIKKQYYGKKKIERISSKEEPRNINAKREHVQVKGTRSFRSDWPFLSEPRCPPELKALAADKISCWERYTENHKKLFDCGSMEECSTIAHEIVKDYNENRLIWEELSHYKKNGAILGVHPVFAHFKRFKKFRGMNAFDLVKEHERVKHRIWRIEHEISKNDKPHLKARREHSLNETKAELAELSRMLNING